MERAAILGTGLIGTSIGLGLRAAGWYVTGWDPDHRAGEAALDRGGVDAMAGARDAALPGADLIVLAGPPSSVIAGLADLTTDVLVTDVAGVKAPVIEAAAHLRHFVGGHPMAGRERAGPRAASPSLFRGASWILTTDGTRASDLERMRQIVGALGAVPVEMTAPEHDAAVATISHLPQVLASLLVELASQDRHALDLAAGSFRDLTRVALSEPDWWAELLIANREALLTCFSELTMALERWTRHLDHHAIDALSAALQNARTVRGAMAPPVVAVGVLMQDRPGELGAVGRALVAGGVDVRDLQLRHGPHGGGGVLTLSVRPGEAETLRAALIAEGFDLAF